MKITEIKYVVDGVMGIKHHLKVIATDKGLEKALSYAERSGGTIKSKTEQEVESVKEFLGSSADRFTTYFMDGANIEEHTYHHALGTQYWRIHS